MLKATFTRDKNSSSVTTAETMEENIEPTLNQKLWFELVKASDISHVKDIK